MIFQSRFLESAQQGKSGCKHYSLAIVFISLFIVVCAVFILVYAITFLGIPLENFNDSFKIEEQSLGFQTFFYAFSCTGICCGIFFATATVHKRHPMTLVNRARKIRFKQFISGFTIWFLLQLLISLILFAFDTKRYVLSDSLTRVILSLPFSLILSFASSALFLVFYAYFLQGLNKITRNQILSISIASFLPSSIYLIQNLNTNPFLSINQFLVGAINQLFLLFLILKFEGIEVTLGLFMADIFYSISIVQSLANNDSPFSQFPGLIKAQPVPEFLWIPILLTNILVFYYTLSRISSAR